MERYSKEWWREYRKKNASKLRAYKRDYDAGRYKTHNEAELERRRRWKRMNTHKVKAQTILNSAVRRGEVQKQPCRCCASTNVHAHHEDYSSPLEVVWLCPIHHAEAHRMAQDN